MTKLNIGGILGELMIVDVRVHPALSLFTDFGNGAVLKAASVSTAS